MARLKAIDDGCGKATIDREIIELVCALNVFGVRTQASCAGHPERMFDPPPAPRPVYPNRPHVFCRLRPTPARFRQDNYCCTRVPGEPWTRCDDVPYTPRERHALALLIWHHHRPLAHRIRTLIHAYDPRPASRIHVQADRRGALLECRDADLIQEDAAPDRHLVLEQREELQAFGSFLQRAWIDGTLDHLLLDEAPCADGACTNPQGRVVQSTPVMRAPTKPQSRGVAWRGWR